MKEAKPTFPKPICRDHGMLVVDLARGRLNVSRGVLAERIRQECPSCRSWWQATLDGEAAAVASAAVAEAFAGFKAPRSQAPRSQAPSSRRRSSQRWLAAAAVFSALALGLWELRSQRGGPPNPGSEPGAHRAEIVAESFESNRPRLTAHVGPATGEPATPSGEIFAGGFESGNFSTWSPEG